MFFHGQLHRTSRKCIPGIIIAYIYIGKMIEFPFPGNYRMGEEGCVFSNSRARAISIIKCPE